jgi:TPR repeat protein
MFGFLKMKNIIKMLSLSLLVKSSLGADATEGDLNIQPDLKAAVSIVPIKPDAQVSLDLNTTIGLFETGHWAAAYKGFKRLCEAGGIIGSSYMTYMEEKGYVDPTVVYGYSVIEAIPEIGKDVSKKYLVASLAFMETEKTEKVKKLATLIVNNNLHAVSLMYRLCQKDKSVFPLLLGAKEFRPVKKKYQSPEDLFKNFVPATAPVTCWNSIDPDYLVYLHNNRGTLPLAQRFTTTELKYFAENYQKKPKNLGKLAQKLAQTKDTKQVAQPLFWAHLAFENGQGNLCGTLAKAFIDLVGVEKVVRKGKMIFAPGEKIHHELGRYYSAHIEKSDLLDAKDVFRLLQHIAADYGNEAFYNPDQRKSFLFDQKAADLGSTASQYDVGVKLRDGKGVEKDPRQALKYFMLAAEQNNTDALFNLGVMHKEGEGVEVDLEKALRYFERAKAKDDDEARRICAFLVSKIGKDLISLKSYADEGNPEAQFHYAVRLYEKLDSCQTLEEQHQQCVLIRHYLEKSAAQDHKLAPYSLAFMLYFGKGGGQDFPRARESYKKAADKGNTEAQHNLAVMMFKGEGGEKDLLGAQKYFQKAANQGRIESIIALQSVKEQLLQDHQEAKQLEILEEEVEIVLPSLPADDADDKESDFLPQKDIAPEKPFYPALENAAADLSLKVEPAQPLDSKETEDLQDQEECARLIKEHEQEVAELRVKSQAQKKAAPLIKQTLTMKRTTYEEMKSPSVGKSQINIKKFQVAHETIEFVKTIFGASIQKMNAFSIHTARKAFADLGCEVSNKKGENSTQLKFFLQGKGVMKFKFHNPHRQGEALYDDLKPYMKRFLESINITPDNLIT